jgi:uncharacterized membrane protein YhhN
MRTFERRDLMGTPSKMTLASPARPWLIAYLVVAVADMVARLVHAEVIDLIGLVLAMPALAGVLLASRPQRTRMIWLVLVSLFFSWLGDWVGDIIQPHVLIKIFFFLLAHLCYIAAFWPFWRHSVLRRPLYLAGYVVVIGVLLAWVAPHSGRLAPALVAYGITLAVMAILATGVHRLTGIGAAIFVASDLSIAVFTFVFPDQFSADGFVIISSYLLAQLLIIIGVIAASPATAAQTGAPRPMVEQP